MIKMNKLIKETLESAAFAAEVALREGELGVDITRFCEETNFGVRVSSVSLTFKNGSIVVFTTSDRIAEPMIAGEPSLADGAL